MLEAILQEAAGVGGERRSFGEGNWWLREEGQMARASPSERRVPMDLAHERSLTTRSDPQMTGRRAIFSFFQVLRHLRQSHLCIVHCSPSSRSTAPSPLAAAGLDFLRLLPSTISLTIQSIFFSSVNVDSERGHRRCTADD